MGLRVCGPKLQVLVELRYDLGLRICGLLVAFVGLRDFRTARCGFVTFRTARMGKL